MMESKLSRIRRSFAAQLVKKHRLKLFVPDHDSSTERFELFVNELIVQLRRKLAKQDEEILTNKKKCSDSVNPLLVQRNQLKTDLDDFETVDKSQNVHRLQRIIERVEYMEIFNTTVNDEPSNPPVPSQTIQLNPMKTNLLQTNSVCHYRKLCLEFLDHLNWPSDVFAHEYDRCFCRNCYPLTMPNIYSNPRDDRHTTIVPRHWMKFGLRVDHVQARIHRIWESWIVSYHGTLPSSALSMVKHRQICLPGDILSDGSQLNIRQGHIPGQRAFFSSPTIRYAAQSCYATPIHFTSQIDRKMYSAKMVLRCRQKPGSFVVQKETLNNNQMMNIDFCDFVSDEQIEWRTEQRGSVIFDSLCVRLKPLFDNPSHKSTSTVSSRFPLK